MPKKPKKSVRFTLVPEHEQYTPIEQREWLSPPHAAKYMDSSPSTLAKLRLSGTGPQFCKFGKFIRYRRCDIDNWLLERRTRHA